MIVVARLRTARKRDESLNEDKDTNENKDEKEEENKNKKEEENKDEGKGVLDKSGDYENCPIH